MKNIIWFIVLIFIIYIILIFIKPTIADKIAGLIGIKKFNEQVLEIKNKMDYVSTKIPTKEDIENAYSWAKDKVKDIKEGIDDLRDTADDIKDKYDDAKEFIDETWEKINKVKESLDNLEGLWENISNIVNKETIE